MNNVSIDVYWGKCGYVYALYCPLKNAYIYVGVTTCLIHRVRQHLSEKTGNPKIKNWTTELKEKGLFKDIEIHVLSIVKTARQRSKSEHYWIRKFWNKHPLLNIAKARHVKPVSYKVKEPLSFKATIGENGSFYLQEIRLTETKKK